MSKLFAKFWKDDEGAIISVELVLVIAILIFGIIPGLVAMRNSIIAALVNIGNALSAVVINVNVNGIGVLDSINGTAGSGISGVAGFQITQAQGPVLTTEGVNPTTTGTIGQVPVDPVAHLAFPTN